MASCLAVICRMPVLPCCRCNARSQPEEETVDDIVVKVLSELVPDGVRRMDSGPLQSPWTITTGMLGTMTRRH
jgi:hypothetical protein